MYDISIFGSDKRERKLSELGDILEKLDKAVDFEIFRPTLDKALSKERKGPGGRNRFDCVMMFKILVIGRLFNLSDDQAEYQINDRISFMRFLDLGMESTVPDAKTIWHYREELKNAGVMETLFNLFNEELEARGIITHEGSIVDATFVEVPEQHVHRDENEQIKAGKIPEEWSENKRRRKDTDARWAKKYSKAFFGFKDHVNVDKDSKVIVGYEVTSASVNDNQKLNDLVTEKDRVVYGDCGYVGKGFEEKFPEGVKSMIHEKAEINHPLTEEQKARNHEKSKIRCRVEHVFGYMETVLHGKRIRSIGIERAKFNIGIMNLVYNICRFAYLSGTPEPESLK